VRGAGGACAWVGCDPPLEPRYRVARRNRAMSRAPARTRPGRPGRAGRAGHGPQRDSGPGRVRTPAKGLRKECGPGRAGSCGPGWARRSISLAKCRGQCGATSPGCTSLDRGTPCACGEQAASSKQQAACSMRQSQGPCGTHSSSSSTRSSTRCSTRSSSIITRSSSIPQQQQQQQQHQQQASKHTGSYTCFAPPARGAPAQRATLAIGRPAGTEPWRAHAPACARRPH
jgi:hypothetical protein